MKKSMCAAALATFLLALFSCSAKKTQTLSVAVFVPGIIADSPIYAMLAEGVQHAVASYNDGKHTSAQASVTVLEAGTNQAEWSAKLTALAAEQKYSVIISSNPSLPELVEPLTVQFPNQKFILLDAYKSGNSAVATVRYNQHEQSYMTGYMAGLMTKSKKIGLIAGQEYPVMNNVILPGYKEGAEAASPGTAVDFRVVGNWYDATKGAELANAMYSSGVDVILPICGGASQGVINAAKEKGKYLAFFDNASFDRAPDNIISCTPLNQAKMAENVTLDYLTGKIEWGTAKTVGVADGFVSFVQDAPNRKNEAVTDEMRAKMRDVVASIENGTLVLPQN
ncbi:BMP family ABC transporter substrate-binding protein [Treponema socranskii]|uniref:BMP family ABC transporter substrate-binding protein n=1 Tax=Treponema socranskii TaxID=53419 RepID=UPI0028F161CE|nr:BMP family ABC transporter substrate-binding protein [Treponema socranskii]